MGRPSIKERILSDNDIEQASEILLEYTERDAYVEQFARQNTNIAINLLCGGARENVKPFAECYFGLAKTVVRADGTLYPCFRMAATRDSLFSFGNILLDTPLSIALKELYVTLFSVQQICVPEHDKCLFCVFNNALETGLTGRHEPSPELAGEYFF
jgi:radical SAM protein with 4Fe4S-binding SPASM domain